MLNIVKRTGLGNLQFQQLGCYLRLCPQPGLEILDKVVLL